MMYFNTDGSAGAFCGNGARCLARFASDSGLSPGILHIESDVGVYRAEFLPDHGHVRVFLDRPTDFDPAWATFEIGGATFTVHRISVGVPHVVTQVDRVSQVDISEVGRQIRHSDLLRPEGTNVNFVSIDTSTGGSRSSITVRTFERGVEGETMSCGSGAIASAFVARAEGWIDSSEATVMTPGGELIVGLEPPAEADSVFLQGSAETVFRGSLVL
jgi:diaminopimelate epimerase